MSVLKIEDPHEEFGFQRQPNIWRDGFPRVVFERKGLKMAMDLKTGFGEVSRGWEDLWECLNPQPVDVYLACDGTFVEPRLSDSHVARSM